MSNDTIFLVVLLLIIFVYLSWIIFGLEKRIKELKRRMEDE
jgi:hypothetical protein